MKKITVFIFVIFSYCGGGNQVVTAESLIPTSEVIWCRTNLEVLTDIYKQVEETGTIRNVSGMSETKREEILAKIQFLEQTISVVSPDIGNLNWKKLTVLNVSLLLSTADNPDNYEELVKSTDICTSWYNSYNS